MSNPVRQHYIPRSYLKNFAEKVGSDKFSVFAKRKEKDEILKISTKDICVEKHLYTIPSDEQTEKFAIEKFYADNVDSVFPEVYRLLTNDNVTSIDFDERLKIINTALSLYFRTPKFLNKQNKLFQDLVNFVKNHSPNEEIKLNYFGKILKFNRNEAEKVIREKKENNRILFLSEHLAAYEKFVNRKLRDGICVYKIVDDSEFITCDNPVIIRPFSDPTSPNYSFEDDILKNPFDPENMIHLPLDKKHILTIMPKSADSNLQEIDRKKITLIDTLIYNNDTEKNSEDYIIGSAVGLKNHISDQIKYNEENEENLKMFDDYKRKVLTMKNHVELLEKHGLQSEIVQNNIKEMKKDPNMVEDINFQEMLNEIEKTLNIRF